MLAQFPSLPFVPAPTIVEPMPSLLMLLGGGPRLSIKRDDAIPFGFGGNKVRKLALVAARAIADGADTLITAGGVQSNHARATAAAAAKLGLRAVLVANGAAPERLTANALLDELLGAEVVYVAVARGSRADDPAGRGAPAPRGPAAVRDSDRRLDAARRARLRRWRWPSSSIRSAPPTSSSTRPRRAGRRPAWSPAAGCSAWPTRVIGISADDSSASLQSTVRAIISGIGDLLDLDPVKLSRGTAIEVDDRFVGDGYGIATDGSREAIELAARTEAIFLDPTYTAKAMAGLIAYVRQQKFKDNQKVLFWHTGGQVGLFA